MAPIRFQFDALSTETIIFRVTQTTRDPYLMFCHVCLSISVYLPISLTVYPLSFFANFFCTAWIRRETGVNVWTFFYIIILRQSCFKSKYLSLPQQKALFLLKLDRYSRWVTFDISIFKWHLLPSFALRDSCPSMRTNKGLTLFPND